MPFTTPPPAPQRGDRATFSSRTDAFLLWLVGLIPQLQEYLASLTTLAAGGANTFSYTFDTATADADPGTGKLRLGSTSQSSAVAMRIDDTAASGGSVAAFLTALAAVTSNTKASVRLQRVNDPSVWALYDVTAITAGTGYRNLTIIPRGSSSASPFVSGDTLIVHFSRTGDKGDSGGTPTTQQIKDALGTLPVGSGGTGATTPEVARNNLDVKQRGTEPISTGGTGATTPAQALTNLGAAPRNNPTFTGQAIFPAGSQSAPSIAFAEPGNDTGFCHLGDGVIGVVCNNVLVGRFTASGLEVIKITQTT